MPDPVITLPSTGGLGGLGADAAGLGSIINLLFGNKTSSNTTTDPTTTTETNIVDQAAIDKTIRDMLEGDKSTNGLAALLTGQKAAGQFGSSTGNLMVNDLVSRIVGEIAKLTSTKVTNKSGTNSTTTNSTQGKAAEAAALAGLMAALKAASSKGAAGGSPNKGGGAPGKPGDNNGTGISPSQETRNTTDTLDMARTDRTNQDAAIVSETFTDDLANSSQELQSIDTSVNEDSLMVDLPTDFSEGYTGDEGPAGTVEVGDPIIVGSGGDGEGGPGEGEGGDYTGIGGGNPGNPDDGDYGGGGGDGGCYITTAVIGSRNLPDNCPELTILRWYRDSWLAKNHPEGIKMYYDDAPTLVEKIERAPNAKQFYDYLYITYILPAIGQILLLRPVEAYNKYREMVVFVQKSVGAR